MGLPSASVELPPPKVGHGSARRQQVVFADAEVAEVPLAESPQLFVGRRHTDGVPVDGGAGVEDVKEPGFRKQRSPLALPPDSRLDFRSQQFNLLSYRVWAKESTSRIIGGRCEAPWSG